MKKNNFIAIFLIIIILALAGLSFYIVKEIEKEDVRTNSMSVVDIKAADITYKKNVSLVTTQAIVPTATIAIEPTKTLLASANITPTTKLLAYITTTPTPTQVNLVTTPIVTQSSSSILLSDSSSATVSSGIATSTPTKIVKTLPQSGVYNMTIVMFIAAISLIFFSFIL